MPESRTTLGILEFADPDAVLPADGDPPHPRLREDVKTEQKVNVYDAAFGHGPRLDKHDVEFVMNPWGPKVSRLLQDIANTSVDMQKVADEEQSGVTAQGCDKAQVSPSSDGTNCAGKASLDSWYRENLQKRSGLSEKFIMSLTKALSGRLVKLQGGWLFILLCVPEGVLRRVVWPMNDHPRETGGAASVHTDQDLHGDPLSGKNCVLRRFLAWKWLRVLNVWMPISHMAVRPLCVMDTQTLQAKDRVRHRWLNHDGWFHLHDHGQVWWWNSSLGRSPGDVVFFDTLRSPHGAFRYVDEDRLGRVRKDVLQCFQAASNDQQIASIQCVLQQALVDCRESPPPVLRALHAAILEAEQLDQLEHKGSRYVLQRVLNHMQRQSLEARVVAIGPVTWQLCCECAICGVAVLLLLFSSRSLKH